MLGLFTYLFIFSPVGINLVQVQKNISNSNTNPTPSPTIFPPITSATNSNNIVVEYRSRPNPSSLPTPSPQSISWDECITITNSRILQTYPKICIYPDGRKVTESITPTPKFETPTQSPLTILSVIKSMIEYGRSFFFK